MEWATHFESPLKIVISNVSVDSLFGKDIIVFLSKVTFSNTGEKHIIHFMGLSIDFIWNMYIQRRYNMNNTKNNSRLKAYIKFPFIWLKTVHWHY